MKEVDFSKILFRCSSVSKLMIEPKTKADKEAGLLSESTKSYLVDVYVSAMYGRKKEFSNKYVEKGLMVEEDSITLYSRIKKEFFQKNEQLLQNNYLKGTPDLFVGKSIKKAQVIIDIKSSWDIFTYFATHTKNINRDYWWQLQGYMALTGASSARLAYCLLDTPDMLISDEKRKLMYKMGAVTNESPEYLEACKELDLSLKYEDIPLDHRLNEFYIERDDAAIESLYNKVELAREYLINFNDELITSWEKQKI
jgi:hypothetical protein